MQLLDIPTGGRAQAHKHAPHKTAICMIDGTAVMCRGDRLQHRIETTAGDLIHSPADMSHVPFNPTDSVARALIARTDPHEQGSVILLPDLDALARI